ncbi:MAG TPA: GMC family oxidoreductase [Allosphingosinicella sp.]|jgi:gluconate 2-dehydrogenase alpha chain
MAMREKPVDVVLVGFGWTGAIMAQQLCDAGMNVLALERAAARDTPVNWAPTFDQDELRYRWRDHLFQNVAYSTLTFRNNADQQALPMRKLGAFLPGTGVGGAGIHWNAQIWRFLPSDFKTRSHNRQRYGAAAVADLSVQDWPVAYEDLEPYYTMFDKLCGVSGKAGNLKGAIQPGGNPFEGARSEDYPTPPLPMTYAPTLFAQAAESMGYHPFPHPAGNLSQAYTNPLGMQLGKCTFCGFCEKFGCGNYSKASPQTTIIPYVLQKANFELRTDCDVLKVERTADGRQATGVTYVDSNGTEHFQPAGIVILTAFQLHNVHLLLLSGIGKPYDPRTGEGVVGKNYCYQTMGSVDVFFEDKLLNPFIGAGSLASVIDNYNGDNFDHGGLGFIGGAYIAALVTGARPIEMTRVPDGVPKWGLEWKQAAAHYFLRNFSLSVHGSNYAQAGNYLDLDPIYRDHFGRPMLRMTFDFTPNDLKMSAYVTDKAAEVARRMGASSVHPKPRKGPFDITPYQTTHTVGGTMMGDNPTDSVVNRYSQSWDVPNLFVTGAGLFPQNAGYNPTGTVAALAYMTADAIKSRYIKAPGPLVQA